MRARRPADVADWTPLVAVLIGEVVTRLVGNTIVKRLVHRNNGVFEAEMELLALWIWVSRLPRKIR